MDKYIERLFKQEVDMLNEAFSWCPSADCKYVYAIEDLRGKPDFTCPMCTKAYCMNCKSEQHKKQTCKEYQISKDPNKAEVETLNFLKAQQNKQCPHCKYWVEKS